MNIIVGRTCRGCRNGPKEVKKSLFLIKKREEKIYSTIPSNIHPNHTTTLLSPSSTIISSDNSNIFSGNHPSHKSFLASMIIAITVITIIVGFIIKKMVFPKANDNKSTLLGHSMASNSSNISESSSNYISSDFNSQVMTEFEHSNYNSYNNYNNFLIDLEQTNVSNSDEAVSEVTNANLSSDIVEGSNYVSDGVSDKSSSFEIELELPSSKTDVNWEDCMK